MSWLLTKSAPGRRNAAVLCAAVITAIFLILAPKAHAGASKDVTVLQGVPFTYQPHDALNTLQADATDTVRIALDGSAIFVGTADRLRAEGIELEIATAGSHELAISSGSAVSTLEVNVLHGVLSILPPVIAIVIALVFKQVVPALLAGIWLGSFFLSGFQPIASLLRIVDRYVVDTLAGPDEGADHIAIIVFTLLLGGMVGIASRMGGMQGIVNKVSRLATNAKRGQLAVWLMGVIIFFDDYTNTLIVGNSTRPLTDRLRISREKLSYIVDSTAAPITSIAVITSWIGFEISLLDQSFASIGVERNPLATFVASLPYSFYPILAVCFVFFVIVMGRDFSQMLVAERRARSLGKVFREGAIPLSNIDSEAVSPAEKATPRLMNGIVPIAVVIIVVVIGLIWTGREALMESGLASITLLESLKESNSFTALLWGSFAGCIAAGILALAQRILNLTEIVAAWVNGVRSMIPAIIILVLAWCIGKVCAEIHTADYLVHNLSGILSPRFLPVIVFLLAMGISFSTGTSWGTMSILIPIVIPLVYGTTRSAGFSSAEMEPVLLSSIAAILSGAVFGDHCSPISDTTIMSSMACAADHIDHVRTQLPYAVTVGIVSLVFGYLLTGFGIPTVIALIAGLAALLLFLRVIGRSPEAENAPR